MNGIAPILIVEDDENDILLLKRAFARANIPHPSLIVRDAEEAILYLSRNEKYAGQTHPPFGIITDLANPRGGGIDLLKWMQGRPEFQSIPVSVLSGSSNPDLIAETHAYGIDSFFIKPSGVNELKNLLIKIHAQWAGRTNLPAGAFSS